MLKIPSFGIIHYPRGFGKESSVQLFANADSKLIQTNIDNIISSYFLETIVVQGRFPCKICFVKLNTEISKLELSKTKVPLQNILEIITKYLQ